MAADQEMDPFSQVYNALWTLAESSARLTGLIRLRNRIKWNDKAWTPPDKLEVSDADLPELALLVTQLSGKIRGTSSGSQALIQLDWMLCTGDPNVCRSVLPVMFAVYAAMCPWIAISANGQVPTINPVQYKGETFVKRVDLVQANLGLTDPERNRGIRGWSSVWACEVEMWFQTSNMIAASQQTTRGV